MAAAICGALGAGKQSLEAGQGALAGYGPASVEWACDGVDRAAGLVAIADARIDDRDALCDKLGVPRAQRGQTADAELILCAFAKWGADCPR